jgi:DNA repair exonuclease SbcCD nuclease subunit
MRILFFSDLHSDSHDDFNITLSNGISSRLQDCLDVIDDVIKIRRKYDCHSVVFGGDLFHTPSEVSTVVFQETYRKMENLANDVGEHGSLIIQAGNHDMASTAIDKIPVSSIYALSKLPNTQVAVGRPRSISLSDDVNIHCFPYANDKSKIDGMVSLLSMAASAYKNKINLLVTHMGLNEAVNGPNEIRVFGYKTSDLKKIGMTHVFSGHHHHPQRISPTHHVIGAPLQLNMLDRGDRRGFLIYDTKKKEVIRVWRKGVKFFLYNVASQKDFDTLQRDQENYADHYIRVMLDESVASTAKVSHLLRVARMSKILPLKKMKTGIRNDSITEAVITNAGRLDSVIESYVKHVRPKLNAERLIIVGKRLVSSAEGY